MTELKPCPFCGQEMQLRQALDVCDGGVDAVIHAQPTDCGLSFDIGTADLCVSVIAAWNHRAAQGQAAHTDHPLRHWDRTCPACNASIDYEQAGQAAESYRQANPLGGPAKVFDAIADAIRAGDPVDQAMREFGVCWQAAPEARMLTEAEVESTLDEAKVPEYPNCDDIDQQIAAVIQRRFCEVNGISLSGAQAGDKEGKVG